MTAAGKSVYYFGIYLLIMGLILIVSPNTLLTMFGLPETNEVWVHLVGVLVFNIGVLYFYMAPVNNAVFFALTAYLRASIIVWFTLFVLLDWAPPMLVFFGAVDLLGAIWTFTALRKS
jgi:uncharacterized membrane protein HdeD (DUF308 family)